MAARASHYAAAQSLRLEDRLGSGVDGIVLRTNRPSAAKVFGRAGSFSRELSCYQRLRDDAVREINGHHVPQLIAWDVDQLVIEMTIVRPPFLLDFAGAYVDAPPDFPADVMEQWNDDKRGQFGHRWDDVLVVLAILRRRHGIHLLDVNPRNITFVESAS